MSTETGVKKAAMLAALENSLGVVTAAAIEVGIDRTTHYAWLLTDEEYKQKVESIKDMALDFAESMLFRNIKNGDTASNIFYLKTQGKNRGYIERSEFTGANGAPLAVTQQHVVRFENMGDE